MHTGKFSLEYKEAVIVSTDKKGDKETITNHHTQALSILAYANDFIKRPEKQIKFIYDDSISLFCIFYDVKASASDVSQDLQLINKWAFEQKVLTQIQLDKSKK